MSSLITRKVAALGVVALLALGIAVTAVPAGTASTAPYCGPTIHKPNGTAWRCAFADNFNGTALSRSRWTVLTSKNVNFGSRPDCFVDSPRNIAVSDGVLRLTTRRTAPFRCTSGSSSYQASGTSATVSTIGHFSQTYGRFQMRAKWSYTPRPGLQASFWMWPRGSNGMLWPISGELDVAEWFSKYPDRAIPYVHSGTSWLNSSTATNNYCILKNPADWHTYTLDWTASSIVIRYDGKTCLTASGGAPFNQPYIVSLTQAFGMTSNSPSGDTPFPATLKVDYLRIWK